MFKDRIQDLIELAIANIEIPIPSDFGNEKRLAEIDRERLISFSKIEGLKIAQTIIKGTALKFALEQQLFHSCHIHDAGFHFEEGGCWGMGYAIAKRFSELGGNAEVLYIKSFCHILIRVGDDCYDHQGRCDIPPKFTIIKLDDLEQVALENGISSVQFHNDVDFANDIIDTAIESTSL